MITEAVFVPLEKVRAQKVLRGFYGHKKCAQLSLIYFVIYFPDINH
jgi:hypothetical protein